MENQVEKHMENDMEIGVLWGHMGLRGFVVWLRKGPGVRKFRVLSI